MTSLEDLCPGCFTDKGDRPVCPACDYDETAQRPPLLLPHRTALQGEYCLGRKLGEMGGFSITYLAWKISLEIPVVIKEFLPRDLASRGNDGVTVYPHTDRDREDFAYGIESFVAEARTLARFDHPNIMRVRHLFEENATAYMVMDYYEGMNLKEYLKAQGGRLSETSAQAIMMPILDGLRDVHEKGFLHRDVKPSNIYLKQHRIPVLLDFGSARIALGERSRSLSVVLTEGYAPFEQYHRQGKQGRWTDVYGCAATLYHLVTGQRPIAATERMAGAELSPPDRLIEGLSASFSDAVQKALTLQPEERTQSIEELQQMLMAEAAPELVTLTPSTDDGAASPKARFRRGRWLVAAAVIVISLLGLTWFVTRPSNPPPVLRAGLAQTGEGPTIAVPEPAGTEPAEADQVTPEPVATVLENRPPQAVDDRTQTRTAKPVTVAVLENDRDPDGNHIRLGSVEKPEHGVAIGNADGSVTYIPQKRFSGEDRFGYVVTDGQLTDRGQVVVTVAAARVPERRKQPPVPPPTRLVATDDVAETEAGQPIDILILENDRFQGRIGIQIENAPAHGEAQLNEYGTLTYRPDPDFEGGTDELTYRMEAGSQVATAKVTIEVKRRKAQPEVAPRPGDVRTHRKDGLAYAWIPPAQEGQPGFWLGQTEVTVGAYTRFAKATVRDIPPQPQGNTASHPVVSINFFDARDFCLRSGGRLPTAIEWEHAARGGLENPLYPWGNDSPSCARDAPNGAAALPRTCKLNGMVEVASYQANGYRLYDMAGNAAEWCSDLVLSDKRVMKGGSFRDKKDLRIQRKAYGHPEETFVFVGFRCLREDPPQR